MRAARCSAALAASCREPRLRSRTTAAARCIGPESFETTIANVIFLGGDTDTLAAMAGALSGSYLGASRLPKRLIKLLENGPKGREYLQKLAGNLLAAYHRRNRSS